MTDTVGGAGRVGRAPRTARPVERSPGRPFFSARRARLFRPALVLAGALAASACGAGDGPADRGPGDAGSPGGGAPVSFTLQSGAFENEGTIPRRFTCDGDDLSPALRWGDPPDGTVAFALVCDDPDAPRGTWVHWTLWDLPATARDLAEGVAARPELPDGSRQGRNDFGRPGYGGPCPPRGPAHRYFFRLYALDASPGLDPGATRAALDRAMKGHVLGEAVLMGRYARR